MEKYLVALDQQRSIMAKPNALACICKLFLQTCNTAPLIFTPNLLIPLHEELMSN
jgi:hypothetical protein